MIIYGLDPGTKQSALIKLTIKGSKPCGIEIHYKPNEEIEDILKWSSGGTLAIEWLQNYGRVIGQEVLRTAYWCGRFVAAASNMKIFEATRPQIVKHFTTQTNVPKAHVRQAILDRFGGTPAKRKGGFIYGISNHTWDALAVAIFMLEIQNVCEPKTWATSGGAR